VGSHAWAKGLEKPNFAVLCLENSSAIHRHLLSLILVSTEGFGSKDKGVMSMNHTT
jgi:hypothetical protein